MFSAMADNQSDTGSVFVQAPNSPPPKPKVVLQPPLYGNPFGELAFESDQPKELYRNDLPPQYNPSVVTYPDAQELIQQEVSVMPALVLDIETEKIFKIASAFTYDIKKRKSGTAKWVIYSLTVSAIVALISQYAVNLIGLAVLDSLIRDAISQAHAVSGNISMNMYLSAAIETVSS